jgi:hypothetical protein
MYTKTDNTIAHRINPYITYWLGVQRPSATSPKNRIEYDPYSVTRIELSRLNIVNLTTVVAMALLSAAHYGVSIEHRPPKTVPVSDPKALIKKFTTASISPWYAGLVDKSLATRPRHDSNPATKPATI